MCSGTYVLRREVRIQEMPGENIPFGLFEMSHCFVVIFRSVKRVYAGWLLIWKFWNLEVRNGTVRVCVVWKLSGNFQDKSLLRENSVFVL